MFNQYLGGVKVRAMALRAIAEISVDVDKYLKPIVTATGSELSHRLV